MDSLERISTAIINALRVLPASGSPGYPSQGDLAAELSFVLRSRLSPVERLTLATATSLSLDPAVAERLAETILAGLRAGSPIPPFTTLRDEARNWASLASHAELHIHLAAIWGQMSEADREGFLRATCSQQRAAA